MGAAIGSAGKQRALSRTPERVLGLAYVHPRQYKPLGGKAGAVEELRFSAMTRTAADRMLDSVA